MGRRDLLRARREPDVSTPRRLCAGRRRERLLAESSPYEWYGDTFIAYVVAVLEEEALQELTNDEAATQAARIQIDEALRSICPGFYHRNLAPEVRDYFEETCPITSSDRRVLADRYIHPIILGTR